MVLLYLFIITHEGHSKSECNMTSLDSNCRDSGLSFTGGKDEIGTMITDQEDACKGVR
jgi:hypothetical protein